jgi:serine/threonine protein kinase
MERLDMKPSAKCLGSSKVQALLQGELPPHEVAEIEKHFSECPACRAQVEDAIGSVEWWGNASRWLREDRQHSGTSPPGRGVDQTEGGTSHPSLNLRGEKNSRQPSAKPRPGNLEVDLEQKHFHLDGLDSESSDHGNAEVQRSSVIVQLLDLLAPSEFPDMLGRIGHYEIAGVLGHGGMGGVFKGFDRSLHRYVAIKMMLPHLAVSGASRARFAREAKAIAAVVDDHVMSIHGVDQWQSVPYFVMPLLRGESLRTRLDDHGPLSLREVLRISMHAARGLAASHAQGIVHRDVKPANLFLDGETDRAQLMDFGIAIAMDDPSLTKTGILAGTPQFMSPEQARGELVTASSDLFSLGSVIYTMSTGHAPFHAETAYGVLRLITDKPARPIQQSNPDIPAWLNDIVIKLMAKQPQDRFESADEVADLLQGCLAHVQQPASVALPEKLQSLQPADARLIDRSRVSLAWIWSSIAIVTLAVLGLKIQTSPQSRIAKPDHVVSIPHRTVVSAGVRLSIDQVWNRWKEMPIESTYEHRAQRHLQRVFQEEISVPSLTEYLNRRRQWATEILPLVTSGVDTKKADFLLRFLHPLNPETEALLGLPEFDSDISDVANTAPSWPENSIAHESTASWDILTTLAVTLGRAGRHTDAQRAMNELFYKVEKTIERHGTEHEVEYLGHYHTTQSVLVWCRHYQAMLQNMTVITLDQNLEDQPSPAPDA